MVNKKVVTIHEVKKNFRFGYETSQVSRSKLCYKMGLEHLYVLTNPQFRGDWLLLFREWGMQGDIICLPFFFSDLALTRPGVDVGRIGNDVTILEEDSSGHVLVAESEHHKIYYLEKKFLQVSKDETKFDLFNAQGQVVLSGEYIRKPYYHGKVFLEPTWIYHYQGKFYTEEELLVLLLQSQHFSSETTVYIRDKIPKKYPILNRFMLNTGKKYYQYIHFDVLKTVEQVLSKNFSRYLCANETLTAELSQRGYDVRFLNPIYTEVVLSSVGKTEKRYCFIGHGGQVKNVETLIEAARLVENSGVVIDIYGLETYEAENLPKNLVFKGYQSNIPFKMYRGYVSTSLSECFANACVEAMSQGLVAILSDVNFAHRDYANKSNNVKLFKTTEELATLLEEEHLVDSREYDFLKDYSVENTAKKIQEL